MASPIASPKTCRTIVSKFEDCDISRVKGVTLPSLCGVKRIALSRFIERAGIGAPSATNDPASVAEVI
jgi:hypothetical protein